MSIREAVAKGAGVELSAVKIVALRDAKTDEVGAPVTLRVEAPREAAHEVECALHQLRRAVNVPPARGSRTGEMGWGATDTYEGRRHSVMGMGGGGRHTYDSEEYT